MRVCTVVRGKGDGPNRVLCPLRVKRHGDIVFRGQVLHRCLIRVSRAASVLLRIPADKVIIFPSERVCSQRLFFIITEAHRIHGARTAVRIEGHRVGVDAAGEFRRVNHVRGHLGDFRIPAVKGIGHTFFIPCWCFAVIARHGTVRNIQIRLQHFPVVIFP